jgi:hypothetical protein
MNGYAKLEGRPGKRAKMDEEQWLQEDDRKSRPFRAARLREVIELFPIPEGGLITFGGSETMTALVEARLAYVNGLYLCTVLSTLTVLERHFAGMLYAKGLESAKRMKFEELLKRAKEAGMFNPEETSSSFAICEMPTRTSGSRCTNSPVSGAPSRTTCHSKTCYIEMRRRRWDFSDDTLGRDLILSYGSISGDIQNVGGIMSKEGLRRRRCNLILS